MKRNTDFKAENSHKRFTKEEREEAACLVKRGGSAAYIAQALGRSETSVRQMINNDLGLSLNSEREQFKRWTNKEVNLLRALWHELYSIDEIAVIMKRSPGSISGGKASFCQDIKRGGGVRAEASMWVIWTVGDHGYSPEEVMAALGIRKLQYQRLKNQAKTKVFLQKDYFESSEPPRGVMRLINKLADNRMAE